MEANIQYTKVIKAMQAEINHLKKENQALQMKLTLSGQRARSSGEESGDEWEEDEAEQCLATTQHAISTDGAQAMPGHQGNVMIVRRYFISSSVHSFGANDARKAGKRHLDTKVLRAPATVKPLGCSSIEKEDSEENMFAEDSCLSNSSSQEASPEHAFGCRERTKTVSFLLPMDMSSYSKTSNSLKCSPSDSPKQLSIIAE
ncbi:putative coiled-coil domain-containing protein 195 [Ochotona princeps]|uniref:putative coiled-coil domain-containing protein 195 n=1 Tax=Ochotona princeps TaxID=9978 RepID=UPI0027149F65|nr:putative coiled-coil domain-containing protein 195 [Ochotona princeps]